MPNIKWTPRQLQVLRKEYPSVEDTRKLAKRLRKSIKAVASKAKLLGLHRKRHSGSPWTAAKVRKLIRLYPNMTNAAIGKKLGVKASQIEAKAFKLRLFKTEAFKRKCFMKSAFRKGHVPVNNGKKMSKEVYEKVKATMFKKGEIPPNKLGYKDGDITIRNEHPDRNGRSYKYIRLSLRKWYPLHQHIWEQTYGPLPKCHCLWFRDGDSLNCSLENLELITRAENMRRNSCSLRLTDSYIANILAREKGGLGLINRDLQKAILQNKELIDMKRQQLLLQRTIKKHDHVKD